MKKQNYFRNFFLAATLFTSAFTFTSCDDNNVEPEAPVELRGPYDQKGVFILNEGNFGTPNGSISFLSDSANHTVINNIFSKANADRPLGDVVMDLDIMEDLAYITVNNSNKLEVVDAYTFETKAVLENLKQPRYFTALNEDKGYVTEWVVYGEPGQVSVIDLNTMQVTKTIPVGPQPEELLIANGKLYVANSGSNVVTVINTLTDTKEVDITVSDGPVELELDQQNRLWVLAAGKTVYNADWSVDYSKTTPGALIAINTATNAVARTLTFGSNQSSPSNLAIMASGDRLYFNYDGKTFAQSTNATTLSGTSLINKSFYGLGVDPETGNIYGAKSAFTGDGTVYVYSPDGTQVNSFRAGIGPNGFVFN
ncbi:YncE family protein [Pontibacter akesuensis]|uniref:40-residue YVTN family beta-propeller repeat-containing protein n=1 Tax=Pontibacter akesuensis TaxID=388950 RepID=A0A1I7JJC1_9BACT|nr:DUF5074 domain-containing protein [Pontibacter akesuensis]GHA69563.1 hypothetical protein GCM10007389_23350 [Pontibacter akesuensis]SFU85259.1 40-residue YVTN family beta-propeller repeat-containing protein [Pontibacter akesuensis]